MIESNIALKSRFVLAMVVLSSITACTDMQKPEKTVLCGDIQPDFVVPPKYPPEIKSRMPLGKVKVKIDILVDGSVTNVRIIESPNPKMNEFVLRAVRQWRYLPGECLPMTNVLVRIH